MHAKKIYKKQNKRKKQKQNKKKYLKSLFFYSGRLFVVLVTIDTGPLLLYVCWAIPPFPVCMLPSIRLTHPRCQVVSAKPDRLSCKHISKKICI